jgi:hypothetical protein
MFLMIWWAINYMLTVDMCSRKDGKHTAISWLLCVDNSCAIIVPCSCIRVYTLTLVYLIQMALNTSRFLHFLNAVYLLGHAEISTSEMKQGFWFSWQKVFRLWFSVLLQCVILLCEYCFRGTCCLHLQDWLESENGKSMFFQNLPISMTLKMEVACSSKTLVSTQKTIQCHSSEGHNLNYIWVQTANEFCIPFLSPEVDWSNPQKLTAYVIKEWENITRRKSGRSCYIRMKFILIMAVPEKGRDSKHKHSPHSN